MNAIPMPQTLPTPRPRSHHRMSAHKAAAAVRATLRGEAVVTLQKLVPALGVLPRDQVYERILDNPELLDGCFQVFRSNPEAFSPLLVRSDKSPIITEADPLRCGRSLSQVIAMVVRSCARRYFRRALKEPAVRRPPPAKPTLLEWLGLVKQAPKKKPLTKADRLYRAISDHLLYEWQARLIPYYAPLPEQLVRALGPRILAIREPAELIEIAQSGRIPATLAPAPEPTLPQPLTGTGAATHGPAGPAASPHGTAARGAARPVASRMLEEELWAACEKGSLGRHMNQPDKAQLRRMVAVAAGANVSVFSTLRTDLNLTPLQTVALLCAVVSAITPGKYLRLFGVPGEKLALDILVMVVRREQFGLMSSPEEIGRQAQEVGVSVLRALRNSTLDL